MTALELYHAQWKLLLDLYQSPTVDMAELEAAEAELERLENLLIQEGPPSDAD